MVRKVITKAKRVYHRGRSFLGRSNMLNNPYFIGTMTAAAKNVLNGQPAIDIKGIQSRITQPNAKNPLIPLALGIMLHNTALKAIGTYLIVDPPIDEEENDDLTQEEIDEIADTIIDEYDDEYDDEDEDEEENNKQQVYIHK